MMTITKNQSTELQDAIEDALAQFCDTELVSGEVAWTLLECYAAAKLAEMNGEFN